MYLQLCIVKVGGATLQHLSDLDLLSGDIRWPLWSSAVDSEILLEDPEKLSWPLWSSAVDSEILLEDPEKLSWPLWSKTTDSQYLNFKANKIENHSANLVETGQIC